MIWRAVILFVAFLSDGLLLALVVVSLRRAGLSRPSLRVRLFVALSTVAMLAAFLTGIGAVGSQLVDPGPAALAPKLLPKVFVVTSGILAMAAIAATLIGTALARPIEALTDAATRIAEGQRAAPLPQGGPREARDLARALTSMRRELENLPYAAAFLRSAWHELKTPIAAIRATVEVLEDGAVDDPEAARRFLANLRASADQLERTVHDLVALARYETASLAQEDSIPVSKLLEDAIARARALADATAVTLSVTDQAGGRRIACDARALGEALGALLVNAVQASAGGRVALDLRADGPQVALEITNAPAEIPEAMRPRLFERAVTRRPGGSGLGLAIARAAVEAHGGTVRFVRFGPPAVCVRVELPSA